MTQVDVPRSTRTHVLLFLLVLSFFFVSGACGLLYQVVWTRKLVLLLGTTSHAVSTVLSIFFLGLGVGSIWGGRLADRTTRPLRAYGIFECIIGLWALGFIVAVTYGEDAVVVLLKQFHLSRGTGTLFRGLLALLLLFVPVSLMGATLPLLARFVSREAKVRGMRIGALYTLNTLGAVAGCFVAGFFLIPRFGYTQTTLLGAAANVAVGLVAWGLSRHRETGAVVERGAEVPPPSEVDAQATMLGLVIAAFFLSGFCSLGLEVLWTRLLAIIFLGTTYAYTTMLTTLLLGIALGSAVASAFVDRLGRPALWLGAVLALTGVGCVYMLGTLAAMPEAVMALQLDSGGDWGAVIRGKVWLSFKALFLPTFFLGMTFPLVVKAVSNTRATLGRDVGRLYFANTVGGVLGSLVGGFLFIPLIGTHWGIVVFALLVTLAGAALIVASPQTSFLFKGLSCATVALLLAGSFWRAPVDVNQSLNAGYIPESHRVIHYKEGVEGTVAVSEPRDERDGTDRVLWINRVQATTSIEKGVKMNRLQGVLPLLFDRQPTDVLFMCFGSGITCGTLALSDFARIDAVDISPEVLEAAPFFEVDNLGVIDRPEVTFHVDDGRNFLLTSERRYDVITFEPMPLAMSGVSTFYTQEYYKLCLEHLKPGGMVSQWIPLHGLTPEIVKSLAYTFTTVFPNYTAWFINADLFLIGSNAPLKLDVVALQARLATPALEKALKDVGFADIPSILGCYLMDEAGLDAYTAGGTVMRDDLPWAEFEAPKLINVRTQHKSMALLEQHMSSPVSLFLPGATPGFLTDVERRHRARTHDMKGLQAYYGGMNIGNKAIDLFVESLEIDPEDKNAQYYLRQIARMQGEVFIRWGDFDKVQALLDKLLPYMPDAPELLEVQAALKAALAEEGAKPE
ncbi:MAG: fused MFS/spermidine synthase [Candidatus Hydrogenedentes bacterium]|nr:fused MFS/spermidine synthase [Candidatus Hydrogenedentota bacterium]